MCVWVRKPGRVFCWSGACLNVILTLITDILMETNCFPLTGNLKQENMQLFYHSYDALSWNTFKSLTKCTTKSTHCFNFKADADFRFCMNNYWTKSFSVYENKQQNHTNYNNNLHVYSAVSGSWVKPVNTTLKSLNKRAFFVFFLLLRIILIHKGG